MSSIDCIDQIGIVEEVREKSVIVRFQSQPACGNCSAKSLCAQASTDNKVIEIQNQTNRFSVGESVKVSISKAMGHKALFYGYLLPFLLVITLLVFSVSIGMNEMVSGLISLSILVPYYFIIYLIREKINRIFIFTLKKVDLI